MRSLSVFGYIKIDGTEYKANDAIKLFSLTDNPMNYSVIGIGENKYGKRVLIVEKLKE